MVEEDSMLKRLASILSEPRGSLRCWAAYLLLLLLPPGYAVSYKALAEALETSPRAIAACMRSNRYAPIIPCHRVVGLNGELRGYSRGGPRVKRRLLELEGVEIVGSRVARVIRSAWELWRVIEENGHRVEVDA